MVAFLLCSKIFLQISPGVQASSHWIVTENGKIQAQPDSVFMMRRPYDLVAFTKQEERSFKLDSMKQELLTRKEEIDKNEDKDTGLEQRFYRSDEDCRMAGKPLPEFDLYISTVLPLENKGIRLEDHINTKSVPSASPKSPHCTPTVPLDFSMHAFEHLEGMKLRQNLSGSPELGLKNAINRNDVDDYGHLVYEGLQKNATSWVLFNMAAFYWRIKGEPYQVVECLRRALHHSPHQQKDVALISLANILHRAHYSNEAAIVVHSALDVSRELNVNHFTLGNIYAVLGEYNKSVICFENTLKIQRDFEAAAKRKHAVRCHAKLEAALEAQHRSLQRTLDELRDYQEQHEHWQSEQEKLLLEQSSADVQFDQRMAYEEHKARQAEAGYVMGEYCSQEELPDGNNVLRCGWAKKPPIFKDFDFLSSWSQSEEAQEPADPSISTTDYMRPVRPPLYHTKQASMLPDAATKLPYKAKEWPSKEECDTYVQKFPAWNEFPTTFLPAENKGFEVKPLLAAAQGLARGQQHPLPWYPPVCVTLADIPEGPRAYDHVQSMRDRTKIPLRLYDAAMKDTLLSYVEAKHNDMTEEEVGQRILTALKRRMEPSWILYNLAGLYWRVIGNNYHALECIRRALYFSPDQYRDVPLVNLANILYKWGRVDDAVSVMRDAVAVNDLEPETHFFLGNLLFAKSNLSGAIYHYEEALSQNAVHKDAFSSLRIIKCYQKFHRSAQSAAPKEVPLPAPATGACQNQPVQQNCKQNLVSGVKNIDQRNVICKNEAGKEACVVETPTNVCPGCKQSCTVTSGSDASNQQSTAPTNQCGGGPPLHHTIVPPQQDECAGEPCRNKCSKQRKKKSKSPNTELDNTTTQTERKKDEKERKTEPKKDENDRKTEQKKDEKKVKTERKQDEQKETKNKPNESDKSKDASSPTPHKVHNILLRFQAKDGKKGKKLVLKHHATIKIAVARPGIDPALLQRIKQVPLHDTIGKIFDEDFNTKLEEISEYYRQKGVCVGDDCHKFMIQTAGQYKPHTKLEIVNGVLYQKLLFGEREEQVITASDCVIFNDGTKSEGCNKEEFKPFDVESLSVEIQYLAAAGNLDNRHLPKPPLAPTPAKTASTETTNQLNKEKKEQKEEEEEDSKEDCEEDCLEDCKEGSEDEDCDEDCDKDCEEECEEDNDVKLKQEKDKEEQAEEEEEYNYYVDQDIVSSEPELMVRLLEDEIDYDPEVLKEAYTDIEIVKLNPDPIRHIRMYYPADMPTWETCKESTRKINFRHFMSTWVSVTTKSIDVKTMMDFTSTIRKYEEPRCSTETVEDESLALDLLPSLKNTRSLTFGPELGLRDPLQKLGSNEPEAIHVIGTRIARALAKDPTNWVLTNLAALYWRVEGRADRAIDCLRVAYKYADDDEKDIGLLSLANILYRSSEYDDALIVINLALQYSPNMVALHFTAGNIYAAKVGVNGLNPMEENWRKASQFYQATLALQPSFGAASERLFAIMCEKVLSNPHIYNIKPKTKKKSNTILLTKSKSTSKEGKEAKTAKRPKKGGQTVRFVKVTDNSAPHRSP